MDENAATDKNAMIAGNAVVDVNAANAVTDVNAVNAVTDANEHITPIILDGGSLPEGAGPQDPRGAADRPDTHLDGHPVVCTRPAGSPPEVDAVVWPTPFELRSRMVALPSLSLHSLSASSGSRGTVA